MKDVVDVEGTGETKYMWRKQKEHSGSVFVPTSRDHFDGYVGSTPISGTVTTHGPTEYIPGFTGFCTLELFVGPSGIVTDASVTTDYADACRPLS